MSLNPFTTFSNETAEWFKAAIGTPTRVQQEAWPVIASGRDILVSAPTGTGKTLSAFLVFIDKLKQQAREGTLKQELKLIYISPLKSLAGDIRENLRRPLDGIPSGDGVMEVTASIRTGDTTQSERRSMIKHPPHILITTPESLYLLLTSKSGSQLLQTAETVILDELHALIDTKRGAHLMFSIARLDRLCGRRLQRIGLSATIEPLELAAHYLSPDGAYIAAPTMEKKISIEITGPMLMAGQRRKDPVWEELGRSVYEACEDCRSVIAFTEGRRYAEKLSYYVNQIAGEGFARVHHGSLSKEQRDETERDLRDGKLRLLCATSSMELGIDVGDIDQVLQVGCPRTISSTMQRLGRAGHNPGRASVMHMYPRTAPECLACGMTAKIAKMGGVEHARPPHMCLDVLSQHLVSMAVNEGYEIHEVLELTARAYPFRDVSMEDVEQILCMLAGDFEHSREIPVRPRLIYDRIHGRISGDTYSRMLAIHAGGTIPDKGLYTVKNEEGVKLGELDEEFVYESMLGDRFLLGSFAWKIVGQNKDTVIVAPASADGARMPFWKGELKGRPLKTSLAFASIMRSLGEAAQSEELLPAIISLGLDEAAASNAADYLKRQIEATGILPDDRTILVEHFRDHNGCHQVMVHSLFGRQVNTPLSILMQYTARQKSGANIGCVDEEEGFLLYPYGDETLPEGLLYEISIDNSRAILEAILPQTPLFSMNFRYNAARALMMGMKMGGRQPLWMQRLRSTEMLDSLLAYPEHPLIRETKRECLEENWDLQGLTEILQKIQDGRIAVREVHTESPSPMSLPFQWKIEAAEMYEYAPVTPGIRQFAAEGLKMAEQISPSPEELERLQERKKLPEDKTQLHSLFMMEGDMVAGELPIPAEWIKSLAEEGLAVYVEPGLWIAAEQREEYLQALEEGAEQQLEHIIRRMLYYRGAKSLNDISERYFLPEDVLTNILSNLCEKGTLTESDGMYYHTKLYDRARNATIKNIRREAITQPSNVYAWIRSSGFHLNATSEEQLKLTLDRCCGTCMPSAYWEDIIFPGRIRRYSESMLDRFLSMGEYFWQMWPDGRLCFQRYKDIDWDTALFQPEDLSEPERRVYEELKQKGASFVHAISYIPEEGNVQDILLNLAQKGLVCADSFIPVRQWQNRDKLKKATARQRVNARVMALSAGRWDIIRPLKQQKPEEILEQLLKETVILCRETFKEAIQSCAPNRQELTWYKALELLSIWEYTGKVRRGYFIQGLSGAQFTMTQNAGRIASAAGESQQEICWLNASDPDQIWGKSIPHLPGKSFQNVPGTAVALTNGAVSAILERQGKTLKLFDTADFDAVMKEFVKSFNEKRLYSSIKRLIVKEYPKEAEQSLKTAGFLKEMQDYVLYR